MSIPKEAIKLATQGGWKFGTWRTNKKEYVFDDIRGVFSDPNFPVDWVRFEASQDAKEGRFIEHVDISTANLVLDPTFWEALGKSLGWEQEDQNTHRLIQLSGSTYFPVGMRQWYKNAHRFYDLILQGIDTVEFWRELLK